MKTKKIKTPLLKETIFQTVLDNGLTVLTLEKEKFNKYYSIFMTRFGSLNNQFTINGSKKITRIPDGVAHFLEHRLFEGEEGNVSDRFAHLGASSNAFTSNSTTAYLFSATKRFYDCLTLLLSFVKRPIFDKKSIAREVGIITQELAMYDNSADYILFKTLLENLYSRHPMRIDIGGTPQSIKKVTPEMLRECHRLFYHPSQMALITCGPVEHKQIVSIAQNITTDWKNDHSEIEFILPQEPRKIRRKKSVKKMSIAMPKALLGFKCNTKLVKTPEGFANELAAHILMDIMFGSSSPIFELLYNDNLVDTSFSTSHKRFVGGAYTLIGGDTKDPEMLQEKIIKYIRDVRKNGFDKREFVRKKRKSLGSFIMTFDSVESITYALMSCHQKEITITDYWRILNKIKYDDIMNQFDIILNENNTSISIINPVG